MRKGEPLAAIHANDRKLLEKAKERLASCYEFSGTRPEKQPLIRAVIE